MSLVGRAMCYLFSIYTTSYPCWTHINQLRTYVNANPQWLPVDIHWRSLDESAKDNNPEVESLVDVELRLLMKILEVVQSTKGEKQINFFMVLSHI